MTRALLQQRILQFLVHSFLYYQLGESLISDQQYDRLCQELQQNLETPPDPPVLYWDLVKQLGPEASGFSIKKYPPPIISTALHLLYQENYANRISFADFLARHGYRFELVSDPSSTPPSAS